MDATTLDDLLARLDGVVSRTQSLAAGLDDDDIARMLRRRAWRRIHPGVYLDHTGPPTRRQREWAAVLHYWPAALCHASAVWPADGAGRAPSWCAEDVVHVAIEHPRNRVQLPGVRLHRLVDLPARVRWNLGPPRLVLEEAVLDVCASAPARTEALAVAAELCQQHRTTAARLLDGLGRRRRLRHGAWLRSTLGDVADGAFSVLEQGYLSRVERAHGLPRGERQAVARASGGVVFRDVEYPRFALVVELDGRVGHELVRDRWRDMERDLVAAACDSLTLRLSWRHVDQHACATAVRVTGVLQRRGWPGAARPCGPGCAVNGQRGRSPAPAAGDRPG